MAFAKQEAFRLLEKALAEGRLGHAYLISGAPGSGVNEFTEELSSLFLGSGPIPVAKDPDFHAIEPGSKSRRLSIEQIRDLEGALHRTPEKGSRKVAVIRDADRLGREAANAFLKTLEEPPDGSLLLLTTELPEALLETIRSRCIAVVLHSVAKPSAGPREDRLAQALPGFFGPGARTDATAAFGLTRIFRDLLDEVREEAAERIKEELSAEKAHFGKTTEGDWEQKEEALKASSESDVLRERSLLLGVAADYFGAALREIHGVVDGGNRDPEESRRLLCCLDALEKLRSTLERGIQEGLALEAGFLELMIASKSGSKST